MRLHKRSVGIAGRPVMLANHLNSMRLERDYTQKTVARLAGVSRMMIHRIETCQTDPSVSVALAVADVLGTSVDKLFELRHRK